MSDAQDRPASVGTYHITATLGEGAYGSVYLAEDTRLGRKVALKLLHPAAVADEVMRRRFRREAEAASRLDHPGICTVYEAGESEGRPYIAMQYIEGETLTDRIEQLQDMSSAESSASRSTSRATTVRRDELLNRVYLIEQVARALHSAHEQGMVHRDIKPSNIMIARDAYPVLCDFGLVRAHQVGEQNLTRTGELFGTPKYMSPEQIERRPDRVDRRADVFSLGVVLYEYLTGRHPFESTTMQGLFRAILEADVADPRSLAPHVSLDLALVLKTALARAPSKRYATAEEFAEDLRRVRAFEPVRAGRIGPLLRFKRWVQRNPSRAAALGLASLLLLGGPTAIAIHESRARAELRKEQARTERQRDAAARSAYVASIAAADARLDGRDASEAVRLLDRCSEVLRGWEWEYLRHRAGASLREIRVSDAPVNAIDVSPAGDLLATGSKDGMLRLWSLPSGELVRTIRAHETGVHRLRFGPEGRRVATAAFIEPRVFVWDVSSGERALTLAGPTKLQQLRFTPDGKHLIGASTTQGQVIVWPLETTAKPRTFAVSLVGDFVLTPAGDLVTLGKRGSGMQVWDFESGRLLRRVAGLPSSPSPLAFSMDPEVKRAAVILHRTPSVMILDVESETVVAEYGGHRGGATAALFAPDGSSLFTASVDGSVMEWNSRTGERKHVLMGHRAAVRALALAGPRLLVSADRVGAARLWRLPPRFADHVLYRAPNGLTGLAWSADGTRLACCSRRRVVRILDATWGDVVAAFRESLGPRGLQKVAFSPDGTLLACGGWQGAIRVLDAQDADERRLLSKQPNAVAAELDFSADGRWLVTQHLRGFTVWSVPSWEPVGRIKLPAGATAIRFAPAGGRFAVSEVEGSVRLFEPGDSTPQVILSVPRRCADAIAFDPGGARLAAGGADGVIRVWDLRSGTLLREMKGHQGTVSVLSWHPDGGRLASGSLDLTIRIWDPDAGETLLVLRDHKAAVTGLAFDPTGVRLASCSMDGTLRVWETRKPELYAQSAGQRDRLRAQALPVVDDLFAEVGNSLDVVARLENDTELPEEVRRVAILEARAREEDPAALVDRAWQVLRSLDKTPTVYRNALDVCRLAMRLDANPELYRAALGAALYRLGDYEEALDTLRRKVEARDLPLRLAFLAMTHHRLGHRDRARRTLDRLANAAGVPGADENPAVASVAQEAARLIAAESD